MNCEHCQKNLATVHVTEILDASETATAEEPAEDRQVKELHLCDVCAKAKDLPHMPVVKNTMADIWKLLQYSAQQTRKRAVVRCPDCGMTLEEFRKKGRLGCPKDYQVFRLQIEELLERVHGATEHRGRVPGLSEKELLRIQRVTDLQQELEIAIREEEYENAARIRDELRELEVAEGTPTARDSGD